MRTLSTIWENNPDTSLTASNLSKYIDTYKNGNILFIDKNDGFLKLRSNSKVSIKLTQTAALYRFNKSFSTHNSNDYLYPISKTNVSSRKEGSSANEDYSVAIESATANLLLNADFNNGLTYWETTGSVGIVEDYESIFGNVARIISAGSKAGISQSYILPDKLTDKSFSFYYKSNNEMKLEVIGNPQGTKRWWRHDSSMKDWVFGSVDVAGHIYSLPSTNNLWKRFELKDIIIVGLQQSIDEIKFSIYSEIVDSYFIDDVQLESKPYCSSFISNIRQDPVFILKKELLNTDSGLVEFETCLKNFNSDVNYIICAETKISSVDKETFRVYYDCVARKMVFEIFNKRTLSQVDSENYERLEHQFSIDDFNALIDRWIRVIITWDLTLQTKEMKMYINNGTAIKEFYFISPAKNFEWYKTGEIERLSFGGKHSSLNSSFISESLFKNIKFNLLSKSTQQISYDLSYKVSTDKDLFGIFEVSNEDICINEYFDSSNPILGNKIYYIWLTTLINSDTASIVISESNVYPDGVYNFCSRLIASFETDANAKILENTLMDLTNLDRKNIMEIVSDIPIDAGFMGEIKMIISPTEKRLIIYDGVDWVRL